MSTSGLPTASCDSGMGCELELEDTGIDGTLSSVSRRESEEEHGPAQRPCRSQRTPPTHRAAEPSFPLRLITVVREPAVACHKTSLCRVRRGIAPSGVHVLADCTSLFPVAGAEEAPEFVGERPGRWGCRGHHG